MESNANYYSASKDIAARINIIGQRYVTKDGRYILSSHDLMAVEFKPEEYVNGLDVKMLTEDEADRLISENGRRFDNPIVESDEREEEEQK